MKTFNMYCLDRSDDYKLHGFYGADFYGGIYIEIKACNSTAYPDTCETDPVKLDEYFQRTQP